MTFLIAWLLWSLLYNNYLGGYWLWPLAVLTPDSWRGTYAFVVAAYAWYGLVILALVTFFGRIGHWGELLRRIWAGLRGAGASTGIAPRTPPPLLPDTDPALFPDLRADAPDVADRLAAELRAGRMNDVDHARITHAWRAGRGRADIAADVRAHGAAACPHGSKARDLPARTAPHDLLLRQVRLGTGVDGERTPHDYRGAGIALDPGVLGTSALVVGPSGSGKSRNVVRPVVESMCLQALAGQATIIAVTSGPPVLPDDAFDVIVRVGDPSSTHGLDLYAETEDPDEAGAILAEALVGDLTETLPGGDSRRAATALSQLIGPYRAIHARFPDVPELRDLLDGTDALAELRSALQAKGLTAQLRELDAYQRQVGSAQDVSGLLASRIALLDRPDFAGFFTAASEAGTPDRRMYSLRILDRPVRVRIDLPERAHAEAARILARLVLAQFTECATARRDRNVFAALVLDDAAQTVSPQILRGLQRLPASNSGVLLTLRTLDDVPERLRTALLGVVGCRIACAGVTAWDAKPFSEVWGTEWVETRTVTDRQLVADEPMTKVVHGLRRLVTGRHVTAQSVTVRREQRQRWSASDLANELPARHAVVSVTTVTGERTPPILTKLGR
ncbi:hypothetical protein GCM10010361_17920 [Streptomyces olivaceiscleroticus]|uniref:ATP-binding protein n=1 Tax=Streptomyces olivaceiscleroticus TaxID=68245 RepID=A0ABN0ZPW2_9ACTN